MRSNHAFLAILCSARVTIAFWRYLIQTQDYAFRLAILLLASLGIYIIIVARASRASRLTINPGMRLTPAVPWWIIHRMRSGSRRRSTLTRSHILPIRRATALVMVSFSRLRHVASPTAMPLQLIGRPLTRGAQAIRKMKASMYHKHCGKYYHAD